jgi:hypothetical protein
MKIVRYTENELLPHYMASHLQFWYILNFKYLEETLKKKARLKKNVEMFIFTHSKSVSIQRTSQINTLSR